MGASPVGHLVQLLKDVVQVAGTAAALNEPARGTVGRVDRHTLVDGRDREGSEHPPQERLTGLAAAQVLDVFAERIEDKPRVGVADVDLRGLVSHHRDNVAAVAVAPFVVTGWGLVELVDHLCTIGGEHTSAVRTARALESPAENIAAGLGGSAVDS